MLANGPFDIFAYGCLMALLAPLTIAVVVARHALLARRRRLRLQERRGAPEHQGSRRSETRLWTIVTLLALAMFGIGCCSMYFILSPNG